MIIEKAYFGEQAILKQTGQQQLMRTLETLFPTFKKQTKSKHIYFC